MKTLRTLLLGGVLLALAGCAASAGGPSLFVLDDNANSAQPERSAKPGQPTLLVAAVDTAAYLGQGGIVYQTAPHRVVVANNNRWASPLAAQLTDGLYAELANALAHVHVARDSGQAQAAAYQLSTQIDAFLGHYDGTAHIAGQWTLTAPGGATVAQQTFDRHVPLSQNGYPALVASLSRGWRQTTAAIGHAVAQALSRRQKNTSAR